MLVFTDAAADKVKALITEEKNSDLMLRVYITGGGCSGFQYGFTFDETVEAGDSQVEMYFPMALDNTILPDRNHRMFDALARLEEERRLAARRAARGIVDE